jgi:hypothetical protein
VFRFEQNFHSVRATKVGGSTEAERVTNMMTEGISEWVTYLGC